MRRPSNRVSQVSTRGDFHPQMAACFQVILTWSSLTTAKLFPSFFLLPLSLFFSFRVAQRPRASANKKRWPEVMARSDQRAGKFSNLGSTGYGKGCARRGGGRVKGEGRGGFARVHPGGYVFSRLCDVFSFSCWSKSEISRYEQMSKVSRRLSLLVATVLRRILPRFTGESSPMFGYTTASPLPGEYFRKSFCKNYSRTITTFRSLFSFKLFMPYETNTRTTVF